MIILFFFTILECVDLYKYCSDWAKAGYCNTEESVRLGCRMSCSDPVCQGVFFQILCVRGDSLFSLHTRSDAFSSNFHECFVPPSEV